MTAAITDYEHMCAVLELPDESIKFLMKAVRKLSHFAATEPDELKKELSKLKMHSGDTNEVLIFQAWYLEWLSDPTKQAFQDDFKEDVWTDFIVQNQKKAKSIASAFTVTPVTTVPAVTVTTGKSVSSTLASSVGSFKWDTKSVPLLPKSKSIQDAYNDWEDSFLVQMTLANVSSVLDDSYLPPTFSASPDEVALNERMQNIVKASIMTATTGTLAAPFLDHKQDGRTMFLRLRSTYKSKDSQQKSAELANKALGLLVFSKTTKLTAEGFSSLFMKHVQQMQDNGSPLPAVLLKSTFLSKVQHPAYSTYKAIETTNNETFEVSLFRFHAWAQDLRVANGGTDPGNDANVKNVNNANQKDGDKKKAWNK